MKKAIYCLKRNFYGIEIDQGLKFFDLNLQMNAQELALFGATDNATP
jgi:hypothetical protein